MRLGAVALPCFPRCPWPLAASLAAVADPCRVFDDDAAEEEEEDACFFFRLMGSGGDTGAFADEEKKNGDEGGGEGEEEAEELSIRACADVIRRDASEPCAF